MKVKRSILESIVRAVIREQVEDEREEAEETTRDTLESVMRIITEVTMDPTWGKSMSMQLVNSIRKLLLQSVKGGSLSASGFLITASKALSHKSENTGASISGDLKKKTLDSIERSEAYQLSSERSRVIAKDALGRIMDAAIGSIVGSEIAYCLLYKLQSVPGVGESLEQADEAETAFAILTGRGAPVAQPPVKIDLPVFVRAFKQVDVGYLARHAWEHVMKFVGSTFSSDFENGHLLNEDSLTDLDRAVLEEEYFEMFGVETPLDFGWQVEPPF